MNKICKYIKDYRLWYMGICILFVVCAFFYHYGLLSIYPLNAEEIFSITSVYSYVNLGTEYHITEYLYSLYAYISTIKLLSLVVFEDGI